MMSANKITLFIASGAALAAMALADPPEASASTDRVMVEMGICQYEDGNLDGSVCLWIDPDTGRGFVNDSSNYR